MAGIYKFPKIEEVVLSNGLHLIMVPDDEQDGLIAIIQFSVGTFSDPLGMEGTVELCTRLLQKGCGRLNAEQFNEKMEYAGASLFSDVLRRACGFGSTHACIEATGDFPFILEDF